MLRDHIGTYESEENELAFSFYKLHDTVEVWVRIGSATFQVLVDELDEIIEMFQLIQEKLQDE